MDSFVNSLSSVCSLLMPIAGVAVLCALTALLCHCISLIKTLKETLIKTHGTISLVDKSIEKVQYPLDTAVKVTGSIDKAYDASAKMFTEAKKFVNENVETLKEKARKKQEPEIVKKPSPEDIIGGK